MTRYLMSIYQPDGGTPAARGAGGRGPRAACAQRGDSRLRARWVFAGGLHAPSTATVVRAARPATLLTHRRALHRGQGAHRRLLDRRGAATSTRRSAGRARPRVRPRCRSRCGRSRTRPSTEPALDPARTSEIERVFRAEHGRAVAVLVRVFGDIGVAEDAVADAFAAARGALAARTALPPSPAGWIITTARRRAIDRLRREASRADRHAQAALLHARDRAGARTRARCATSGCG